MFDDKPLIEKELVYCKLTTCWGPHSGNNGGFMISYGAKGYGFGNITFIIEKDGSLTCDNELESRETVRHILNQFVDRAKFRDPKGDDGEAIKKEFHGKEEWKDA